MVSTEQGNTLWPPRLEQQQQGKRLEGVISPVNEITHEDVVGIGYVSSGLEKLQQVMELPVNVTAHRDLPGSRCRGQSSGFRV